jgi:aldehyde dehydrogenase (NAD+)
VRDYRKFYIGGEWVAPAIPEQTEVIDPTTGRVSGLISRGSAADVDRAVECARTAFESWSHTTREERIAVLTRIKGCLEARYQDMTAAISEELGAPIWLARDMQAALGIAHLQVAIGVLQNFPFEEARGTTQIVREPVGICGLITPWNWPLHQIAAKVVPALAAGCTMVLKPAELAPFSAHIWAEVLDEAGVPPGVFNMVDGRGTVIGAAISAHPDIDMVSFTGSTNAGIEVARNAAQTVKRVCQELGGKSANIVLADADLELAVSGAVKGAMLNTGQTCSALTRLLVPATHIDAVVRIAAAAADAISVGPPSENHEMGPLVSQGQWTTVQALIETGIAEGARLIAGGPGKPEGLEEGYYARPTVFAGVTPQMTIGREEIFGPVLSIIAYDTVEEAIAIANDSPYGLSGGVQGNDPAQVREVARRLRTGQVYLNGAGVDFTAPFGGYKQSGNGREWGDFAFAEYLEVKAIIGANPPA